MTMPVRDNAELWEGARCTAARLKRRLIARGASVRGRRVGPRVAEGSEAGLRAGDRGEGFKRSRVDGAARSSRVTVTT